MASKDKVRLTAINKFIVVFVFANIVIIGLSALSYLQSGEFNSTSIVVGLAILISAILIKLLLGKKVKAAASRRSERE